MKTKKISRKGGPARPGEAKNTRPRKLVLRRILVAVDFSSHSKRALEYALALAAQHHGRVSLLHVVQVPSMAMQPVVGGGLGLASLERDKVVKQSQEQLARTVSETIPRGIAGHKLVRVGVPYDEIVRTARKLSMDLIVLGTHGLSGLKRMVSGSTAERVVRYAPCPVLTVRDSA